MQLDRVTITGADDSVSVGDILKLSQEFPFVEWGILASKTSMGRPRFPSQRWITDLQGIAETTGGLALSLHLCGSWVRDLLLGSVTFPGELLHCFQRVQLNFHADGARCDEQRFAEALKVFDGRPIIFQLDGAWGNDHMYAANIEDVRNCYGLFDVSGGAGILPTTWPPPFMLEMLPGPDGEGVERFAYQGYAGGLGPDNLAEQLPLIATAAGDCRIWVDMETRVRSDDDRRFDLEKVRRALEICQPFVGVTV